MKIISGNIIELAGKGVFDVIVHGCNCEALMGAGLTREIRETYPDAYRADQGTKAMDPNDKLGGITGADVCSAAGNKFTIVNGYTQLHAFRAGSSEPLVDYGAIRSVFRTVAEYYDNKRIAYPKIGAGRAGGDWDYIAEIIEEELDGLDHTLVLFPADQQNG